jgi:acyl-CoA reductase-like NAD-dependent aldehyde dehydrogenase
LLESDTPHLVAALQTEGGFTQTDAQNGIRRCILAFKLWAEEARRLSGARLPLDGVPQHAGLLGFTIRVPLGVVCAITPFNAPLNTVAHKVAPASWQATRPS